MELTLEIPKLYIGTVYTSLFHNCSTDVTTKGGRKRKMPPSAFGNIIVNDVFFDRNTKDKTSRLCANVSEVKRSLRKPTEREHLIEVQFVGKGEHVDSVVCTQCAEAKVHCNAISSFMYFLQRTVVETPNALENVKTEDSVAKKIKVQECAVVLEEVTFTKPIPTSPVVAPVLTKLKKAPTPFTQLQLESAQKLSLFTLIREYGGNSPDDFLQFCRERMAQECCSSVELLTIEQADTDLWHELRKGRITASRIHEASRCTMLSGSLTNKIMGIWSGFSFAMKRGTDLEGHVFAELQKEYPGLRNTGLVLDPQFPWMGASPDGICDEFVLEIKCPYTPKTYDCYVDVKKLSKKYFAQIHLQMHMTHKTKALLGVAALDFETTKNVTKVWIDYDKAYVSQIMEEAYEFWCKAVFKALLKKRSIKK